MDYGAFIRIQEGIEGLIHNSELDWTNKNVKPSKVLSVSQNIKFKIVNIDKKNVGVYDNPMPQDIRKKLLAYFSKYNEDLFDLIDARFDWDK